MYIIGQNWCSLQLRYFQAYFMTKTTILGMDNIAQCESNAIHYYCSCTTFKSLKAAESKV